MACCLRPRRRSRAGRRVAAVTLSPARASAGRQPVDMSYPFRGAARAPAFPHDSRGCSSTALDDRRRADVDRRPRAAARRRGNWKPGATGRATRARCSSREFPYAGRRPRRSRALLAGRPASGCRSTGDDRGMRVVPGGHVRRCAATDEPVRGDHGRLARRRERRDSGTGVAVVAEGRATLSFRNPKRAVDLFLQLDQPVTALPASQQVEVRWAGGGRRHLHARRRLDTAVRRIPLSAAQLGTGRYGRDDGRGGSDVRPGRHPAAEEHRPPGAGHPACFNARSSDARKREALTGR